tara:strand:+ start:393 stop:587 length:195 start_codon:yes stop_codon:yes gene_type:complete
MNTLLKTLKEFLSDECASHAAEYVTVTAISVGGLTASLKSVKDAGEDKFTEIANTISGTPSEGG